MSTAPKVATDLLLLPGEWTVVRAAELKALIGNRPWEPGGLRISARETTRLDTSILQLFCAVRQSSGSLALDDPNGVIAAEAARNGLEAVVDKMIQTSIL